MKNIFLIILLTLLFSFSIAQENKNEKTEKLVEKFTKKIEQNSNCLDCYYERSIAYIFLNNKEKSIIDIEKLKIIDVEGWRYHHASGLYEYIFGDNALAIEHYKKAVSINKYNSELLVQNAQLELLNGEPKIAIASLIDLKVQLEKNLDDCNYNLAGGYYLEHNLEEALKYINQIKNVDFNTSRLKGKILIEKGDFSQGIKVLNELAVKYPEEKEIVVLIIKYYIGNKKFKDAKDLLGKIINGDPLNNDLEFDRLLFLKSEDKEIITQLIKYFISNKYFKEAKYLLNKLDRIDPLNKDTKALLDMCRPKN